MHSVEKLCIQLRHTPWLSRAGWLWDRLRDPYNDFIAAWFGIEGIERVINGTDRVRISPQFRGVGEAYEPETWRRLVSEVHPGDIVADVGAFIGLYSIALAFRVGPEGRVTAFEPDAHNFMALEAHCRLNRIDSVELMNVAVGDEDGPVRFDSGRGSESRVSCTAGTSGTVRCVRLDSVFEHRRLDILKIDVEGYEEAVLRGAVRLLGDRNRRPRMVLMEVHPYAWPALGTTGESLLDNL
jgi:FkbM family methyltransferase